MDRLAAMDAFIRVVDAGSFSGAAKQLHMGQPAVSKAIVQLEERLSVRLLLRTTRQLTPTEAGRDFYERAKRSIEEADAAEFAARGSATTLSGRLRVQATAFARLHVIPHLPRFLAQHPALTDWSLPPVEAWAIFPAGRQVSTKARTFASFIESQVVDWRKYAFSTRMVSNKPLT